GYCTFFGGKYVHEEADAKAKSKTNGRLACTTTAGAKSPKCGTRQDDPNAPSPYVTDPLTLTNMGELLTFVDSMVYPRPSGDRFAIQGWFAWFHPPLPHEHLASLTDGVTTALFGTNKCAGFFELGDFCPSCPANCPALTPFEEDEKGGTEYQYYANVE